MKRITFLLPLLLILLLAVDSLAAQPLIPELPVIAGLADEGGHGDDEEAHADDEDDHNDDDGHHDDDDGHASDDGHHDDDGGHANDDGHHGGPFTWASLIPLFAGIGIATIVSGASASMTTASLGSTELATIALTTITGVLHFVLGMGGQGLLLLNGLGYMALLALLYLPIPALASMKPPIRIALVVYTAVTFVAYFALHSVAQFDALGILSKLVEAVLIGLLVMQIVRPNSAT